MRILKWTLSVAALGMLVAGLLGFWLGGYRGYIIHTGSMAPTIKPGYLLIDSPPGGGYRPGEVITFRHSDRSTDLVTHRFFATVDGLIETKGDANPTPDPWRIRPDQVRGRVVMAVPYAGYAVVYLQQPAGVASLVVGLLSLILLWRLFFDEPDRSDTADVSPESAGHPMIGAPA